MQSDTHERARFLIDESRVAGISPEETSWLCAHLAECAECAHQEEITARMLGAMSELSFGRTDERFVLSVRQSKAAAWRWPLAAAAAILLTAFPLIKHSRDLSRDQADALLLERVGDHVSRTVPQALEPLMDPDGDRQ